MANAFFSKIGARLKELRRRIGEGFRRWKTSRLKPWFQRKRTAFKSWKQRRASGAKKVFAWTKVKLMKTWAWSKKQLKNLFLRIGPYIFGNGVKVEEDNVSHRKNWPVKPTGLNWKYFFWFTVTMTLLFWVTPTFIPNEEILGSGIHWRFIYYLVLSAYLIASAFNWDKSERERLYKEGGVITEVEEDDDEEEDDDGMIENLGGTGYDIRTNGWRPVVRPNERALIFFLGTPICEVSGGLWIPLPIGFFSIFFFPKQPIEREIRVTQRVDAIKKFDGTDITKEERKDDPYMMAQVAVITLAYAFQIPKGYLLRFVKRVNNITAAVTIIDDTNSAELGTVVRPLAYKELSARGEDVAKRLLAACSNAVMEPMGKKRSPEDSFGIDMLFTSIKSISLSNEVTAAINLNAASVPALDRKKREAEGLAVEKSAESYGPLKGTSDGILAHFKMLGLVDDKGIAKEGKEKDLERVFNTIYAKETLSGMELKNISVGQNVQDLLEGLFRNKANAA